MNQDEKRRYLIKRLLKERPEYENIQISSDVVEQKMLLRLLMNIRMPGKMDHAFLQIQDAYLSEENEKKGTVTLADIREVQPDLHIWKGDITRLGVGAIVNAANSGMTGCYQPCHKETYDNEDKIKKMVLSQGFQIKDGELQKSEDGEIKLTVPFSLIPYCPRCGKLMSMNLRSDQTFVEDDGWHQAAERYEKFIQDHKKQKIVFLELGVGYNTPGIIKYPFWQMTNTFQHAFYVCLNQGEAYAPEEIRRKSVCMNEDIGEILKEL